MLAILLHYWLMLPVIGQSGTSSGGGVTKSPWIDFFLEISAFAKVYVKPSKSYLTHWPLGNFNKVFKFILAIDGWDISHEISSRWMSLDLTDDKSTLVQVMAWCRQATSHYLSQCWPRSLSPYGVTRPQWVKLWWHLWYSLRWTMFQSFWKTRWITE